jgi:hypothetical protein
MKRTTTFRKWSIVGATVLCWNLAGLLAFAQTPANRMRVGVYDSRAVAVAYANSTESREAMKPVETEHQKAKAAQDQKKMKELASRMKLRQLRMHEQGFSTGSVAGIMETVKGQLPDVAKKLGVAVIVSKWELNFQSAEVEVVDVTDELVALFHVTDKGKEWAKGVKSRPPVPLEEITQELD